MISYWSMSYLTVCFLTFKHVSTFYLSIWNLISRVFLLCSQRHMIPTFETSSDFHYASAYGSFLEMSQVHLKVWKYIQGFYICHKIIRCVCAQPTPTLSNPMDSSPPGSSVHGIFQARILDWVAISSSRGSSWPRDRPCVSCIFCIGREILYHWEAGNYNNTFFFKL